MMLFGRNEGAGTKLSRLPGELLLNLIYPRRAICMGCGELLGLDRDDLCQACRSELTRNWIGLRQPPPGLKLDGAAYAHPYAGPAGSMARNLKYGSVWILSERMGEDVARAAQQLRIGRIDCVTAVPMHPRRLRLRGKNHAELLARRAAELLEAPYAELLLRTRDAPQQARLTARERRRNLKDGFAVPPEREALVVGATILLVDDIFTTGATAGSCARALRRAGARRVFFASYALSGGGKRKR